MPYPYGTCVDMPFGCKKRTFIDRIRLQRGLGARPDAPRPHGQRAESGPAVPVALRWRPTYFREMAGPIPMLWPVCAVALWAVVVSCCLPRLSGHAAGGAWRLAAQNRKKHGIIPAKPKG